MGVLGQASQIAGCETQHALRLKGRAVVKTMVVGAVLEATGCAERGGHKARLPSPLFRPEPSRSNHQQYLLLACGEVGALTTEDITDELPVDTVAVGPQDGVRVPGMMLC